MKQVALKAEEAEIEKWKGLAESEGLGLSAWIRKRCNMQFYTLGGEVAPVDMPKASKSEGRVPPVDMSRFLP